MRLARLVFKTSFVFLLFFHLQLWAFEGLPAGEILLDIQKAEKLQEPPPSFPEINIESWDPMAMPEAVKSWLQINIPKEDYLQLIRNVSKKNGEPIFK